VVAGGVLGCSGDIGDGQRSASSISISLGSFSLVRKIWPKSTNKLNALKLPLQMSMSLSSTTSGGSSYRNSPGDEFLLPLFFLSNFISPDSYFKLFNTSTKSKESSSITLFSLKLLFFLKNSLACSGVHLRDVKGNLSIFKSLKK